MLVNPRFLGRLSRKPTVTFCIASEERAYIMGPLDGYPMLDTVLCSSFWSLPKNEWLSVSQPKLVNLGF